MPSDSRRRILAGLFAVLTGCAGTPETPTDTPFRDSTDRPPATGTTVPTDSPTDSAADPSTEETDSSTDSATARPLVKSIPADDPAVNWAVELRRTPYKGPAVSADGRHVAFAFGEVGVGTPTDDGPHGALAMLDGSSGTLRWDADTPRPPSDDPIFVDGDLHTLTGFSNGYDGRDQRVTAYSSAGDRLWQSEAIPGFLWVSAVADGRLYVVTSDDLTGIPTETLYAFGPDGAVEWTQSVGDGATGRVSDDTLLVSGVGTGVAALDRRTGTERWRLAADHVGSAAEPISVTDGLCLLHPFPDGTMTETPTPSERESTPTGTEMDGDTSTNPGLLVAYALDDGTEQWRYDPAEFGDDAEPTDLVTTPGQTGAEETEAVFAVSDRTGIAIGRGGAEHWRETFHRGSTLSLAGGDPVFAGVDDDGVFALDPTDGATLWQTSHAGTVDVSPLGDGVLVRAGSRHSETLTAYDRNGTARWQFGPTDIELVTRERDRVYVTTAKDRLYALGPPVKS